MLRRIARLRVTIGFIEGVVVLWLARPSPRSLAMGALVAVAGEAIRVWAAGHLEKGREVTTSGPYAFTRHPLYLGSSIMGIGLAIACANLVAAVVVLAYLAVTLTAAMRTEEAHLTEKFGAAYPAYRDGRSSGEGGRFSTARVVRNREYRGLLGLLAVMLVLAWKTHW
jgi:protein-S-isoprenylcysteine O-methyltransferase Ste14